jgi:hypothetical protein
VAGNYERATALELSSLVTAAHPSAGRLILWHGLPGTGKTTALRALARAWAPWCATHVITDPERLLDSSTYLMDVLAAEPTDPTMSAPAWKLIALEDAGELLSVDAQDRTGQALSRLLNATDGLLGQGTNVILLVTTNEPLRSLHPALTRPGRCWCTVPFEPLGVEQANQWLTGRGCAVRIRQSATLAELYETMRGREPEIRRPFGFAARAS